MREGGISVKHTHFSEQLQREHSENTEGKEKYWAEQLAELLEQEYKDRKGLGTGKSGEVWIGQAPFFERVSCVKTIHDPAASVNSLKREYELHQKFLDAGVRAPELIGYIEAKSPEGNIGIMAMEAIPGGQTFEQWIKGLEARGETIPKSLFDQIKADLKQQINKAHDANLYHRDLNWRNVMIDENYQIYIIDFGDATQALGGEEERDIYRTDIARDGQVNPIVFRNDEFVLNYISNEAHQRGVLADAA
ncbi:MAG: lipopolysaccharide kinase InaA family protein [bacterium]